MSFQRVAMIRRPPVSSRFSRASGSRLPRSRTNSPARSGPKPNRWAASWAESQADPACGWGPRTDRSATPLCDSSHRLRPYGAVAVSSSGIPAVADRTAASTHEEATTRATDANEESVHSGRFDRQQAGSGCPAAKKPAPQPSAFMRPCACRRGA